MGRSSPALPTRDSRGSLFRSASTRPDQSQVPSSGSRVAGANPRSNSTQPAQQGTRRRVRTYLVGGVSGNRLSAAKWGSSQDESPRPACAGGREFSRRSSTAPSGPRRGLSPPAGSSRDSAAKVVWQDSSPLPPRPSLTAREEESGAQRPRNPGSPPSGPCGALARPRTRAGGVGRAATAISA